MNWISKLLKRRVWTTTESASARFTSTHVPYRCDSLRYETVSEEIIVIQKSDDGRERAWKEDLDGDQTPLSPDAARVIIANAMMVDDSKKATE